MQSIIHTAYSYSKKDRQYIAAAYVLESEHTGLPFSHTYKVLANYAIDENKIEAIQETIRRILKNNKRHPENMLVINHGRHSREIVTNFCF